MSVKRTLPVVMGNEKEEVLSGENGEITLKVEIDPAQVEDVGLQDPPDRGGGSGIRRFTKNEDGV